MSRLKDLGKNSFYIMVGTFGSKAIGFLMLPFYTRWLSVDDYGLTDILTVYSSLLVCLLTLSLHEAIFVYPVGKSQIKQALYFSTGLWSIIVIFLLSVFLGILCYQICGYLDIHNSFIDNIHILLLMYVVIAIQTYTQQFCRSINRMRSYSFAGIIVTISMALLSFLLIPAYGAIGYIIAIILSNGISSAFIFFTEKLYRYIILRGWKKSVFFQMSTYSVPMIPNTFMWWVLGAINRPILEANLGLAGIGIFAVSNKFPSMLSQVSTIFTGAWQVSVLQEYGKNDFEGFYNKIGNAYICCLFLLSTFLCVTSKFLVCSFIDEKFYDAWKYIPIMTVAIVFQGISSHTGSVFSAAKKSKYFLISSIVGAIMSAILNISLIPIWGLYGAALSFTLSQCSIALVRVYYSNKLVKFDIYLTSIVMMIVNVFCIICVLIGMNGLSVISFILSIIIFLIINRHKILSLLNRVVLQRFSRNGNI